MYMANIFSFSIFIYCFQVSLSQKNVGNIECNKDLSSFDKPWNRCRDEGCRGQCTSSCIAVNKDIRGTEIYTYDSPICKAALHDFRISSWNETARTVEFQYLNTTQTYVGSIRQNIKSKDYGKLSSSSDGSYFFKSPRITEEILDVISLHHNYFVEDGGSHTLECRVSSNAVGKKIYFSKFPESAEVEAPAHLRGSETYYTNSWRISGGFWCKPEQSMLSGVLSLAMRKYSFNLPTELTITKSIGDYAEINMKSFSVSNSKYWMKNEERFSSFINASFGHTGNDSYIKFYSLKIGDAGFYGLVNNKNDTGVTRLIIRVCKDKMYGPLCEHECPNCLNGGVCHDLTGDCVCPPGFNGTLCENACQPGFFGRNCNQQCFDEQNNTTNCSEILFCLPDPYGCSCISGFTSVFCNQTCAPGYYGAGCTQKCSHCKDSETCEAETGKCPEGCEEGWHGTPCVLSYPAFRNVPTVESIKSDSVELMFKEWEESKGNGTGTPEYYIVQYKISEAKISEWKGVEEIKANSRSDKNYTVLLKNLQFGTTYNIRVIIKDISGQEQLNGIPTLETTTLCGVPEEIPKNIIINNTTSRRITVNWELPPSNSWKCKSTFVNVFYNSSGSNNLFSNTTSTSFSINTEPFTEWNIALRLINKDYAGEWTSLFNAVSAQDAPSKVEINSVTGNVTWISLIWNKPKKENGIITKYIIRYQQVKWLHSCSLIKNIKLRKEVEANVTSVMIDTCPNSEYRISISAETVKPGIESFVNAETEESVPGGPPQNLKIINIEKNYVGMQWESPLCNLTYGEITEYRYVLKSQNPWDSEDKSGEFNNQTIFVYNLTAYTFYTARVFAGTKAGFSKYFAEINFTTKIDVPPAPTNLTIYARTESILSMSWTPPYPPKGILEKYSFKYQCLGNPNYIRKETIKINSDEFKCADDHRENHHCYTLKNLLGNQKYKIEIAAYNEKINEASEKVTISADTKESVSDTPVKAETVNVTEHSVEINWSLPSKSNENLTGYRINITAAESYNSQIIGSSQWNVTDSNTRRCEFFNLHSTTTYNITLEARTKVGYGKPFWFQFTTKFSEPVINFESAVSNITDSTVVVTIKPIRFEGPISAYFVMVKKEKKREKRAIAKEDLRSYNDSSDHYVAAKFYPEKINSVGTDFTVGDGQHYNGFYNAPLNTGDKYKVGLAILSEFKGEERIAYKYLNEVVTVKKPDNITVIRSNLPGIITGVIVGIIIIIFIIMFIIDRCRKSLKNESNMEDSDVRSSMRERQSITITDYFEESA